MGIIIERQDRFTSKNKVLMNDPTKRKTYCHIIAITIKKVCDVAAAWGRYGGAMTYTELEKLPK